MVFPACDQATEVVQPGKEPLHLPAPPVPAQRSSILGFAPSSPIWSDELDAVLGPELLVEPVRVVSLVADQPRRELVKEASRKHAFDKLAFRRASAFNSNGER